MSAKASVPNPEFVSALRAACKAAEYSCTESPKNSGRFIIRDAQTVDLGIVEKTHTHNPQQSGTKRALEKIFGNPETHCWPEALIAWANQKMEWGKNIKAVEITPPAAPQLFVPSIVATSVPSRVASNRSAPVSVTPAQKETCVRTRVSSDYLREHVTDHLVDSGIFDMDQLVAAVRRYFPRANPHHVRYTVIEPDNAFWEHGPNLGPLRVWQAVQKLRSEGGQKPISLYDFWGRPDLQSMPDSRVPEKAAYAQLLSAFELPENLRFCSIYRFLKNTDITPGQLRRCFTDISTAYTAQVDGEPTPAYVLDFISNRLRVTPQFIVSMDLWQRACGREAFRPASTREARGQLAEAAA